MDDNPLESMLNLLAPCLGFTVERFERFVCWARYLHWADLQRRHYLAWTETQGKRDDMESAWELTWLEAAWYASLYVVVEGWGEVPLSDPAVDDLLAANPRYTENLKRYRNSVFHYQSTHDKIHKRQAGFRAEGLVSVAWAHLLHDEFCRVYWQKLPRVAHYPDSPQQNERYAQRAAELVGEIRGCMQALVGWIPTQIVAAQTEKLRGFSGDAMARLREAGDFESEEAQRLLALMREVPDLITEAEFKHEARRHETIEQVKATAPADVGPGDHDEPAELRNRPVKSKLQ
jgi:hypothetical protein